MLQEIRRATFERGDSLATDVTMPTNVPATAESSQESIGCAATVCDWSVRVVTSPIDKDCSESWNPCDPDAKCAFVFSDVTGVGEVRGGVGVDGRWLLDIGGVGKTSVRSFCESEVNFSKPYKRA